MGYARIFARAVSNPGPPDYSFEDINVMPFYHSAICADSRVVKGIVFMSSLTMMMTTMAVTTLMTTPCDSDDDDVTTTMTTLKDC